MWGGGREQWCPAPLADVLMACTLCRCVTRPGVLVSKGRQLVQGHALASCPAEQGRIAAGSCFAATTPPCGVIAVIVGPEGCNVWPTTKHPRPTYVAMRLLDGKEIMLTHKADRVSGFCLVLPCPARE